VKIIFTIIIIIINRTDAAYCYRCCMVCMLVIWQCPAIKGWTDRDTIWETKQKLASGTMY